MSPRRTIIKICGLTHEEHVHAAADGGASLVGFVLWPKSPRALALDRALALAALAGARGLESVAVVVDPTRDELPTLAAFDRVQFHGAEACADLAATPKPALKGLPFAPESVRAWDACPHATWLLVDGARGGAGEAFDHAALAAIMPTIKKPLLLAGGLTPTNVASAIRAVRPYGVDVSSGVERSRGVKDVRLIAAFCAAVKEADS